MQNTLSEEIKDLKPLTFRKLFSNDQIFEQIVLTLFPEKTTLKLLLNYFESKETTIYKNLGNMLRETIKSLPNIKCCGKARVPR
jgi:hypothetical protein